MAKPIEVIDEHNVTWLVFDGDPASLMVKPLVKLGLSLIVLPRNTIRSGILEEVPVPDFSGVTDAVLEIEEVRQDVIHKTRARQIYEYLIGDSVGNS